MGRRTDLGVINSCRKDYCELCGAAAHGWPHHIKPKGAGGRDVRTNLIQLCGACHRAAHDGKIKRRTLMEIVAAREEIPLQDLYSLQGWLFNNNLPDSVTINPLAGKSLEEVIEMYLFCLEKGEDSMWDRAAIVTALHQAGMKPREIASALGCSASLCRKFVRTFDAFPDPETRVPFLSFRHHVIAAFTDDPHYWIQTAADENLSTRQLQEKINSRHISDKDIEFDKAERALRLAEEVLGKPTEAALWLKEELKTLLEGSDSHAPGERAEPYPCAV